MRMRLFIGGLCLAAALTAAPGDTRLADAAQRGDKTTVRSLLAQRADVNGAQADGTTALHWAAYKNDADIVDALIRAGAKVDAQTRDGGITPLSLAASNGNAAAVEALLKGGANPNLTVEEGETPLMAAAHSGSTAAVKALLDKGADVNAKEKVRGQTVLMWAAVENHADVVKLLAAKGADVNVQTAVVQYGRRGRAAAAAADVPPPPPVEKDHAVQSAPASQAAAAAAGATGAGRGGAATPAGAPPVEAAGAVDLTGASNALGGTVKSVNYNVMGGMTALLFAAREGNIEAAKALLDAGTNPNQQAGGDKSNALVLAINNAHYDFARFMVEHGADVNVANIYGAEALYSVIDFRNVEMSWRATPRTNKEKTDAIDLIKVILDHGADLNARLKDKLPYRPSGQDRAWIYTAGATPFWRAAVADDVEVMKVLIAKGADPKIPSFENVTPLMVAAGLGWEGGQTQTWPTWLEAVKYCVEDLKLDVNAKDIYGYTALHGAAYRGDNEVVEYLAKKGANLEAKSRKGQTAWNMADGVFTTADLPIHHGETVALLEKLGAKQNPSGSASSHAAQ